jgi:signal transduction histidine kinase/CheY-like chemotaxis protein/HPt (histidine-containing phosphotransfer) domain-containing protein
MRQINPYKLFLFFTLLNIHSEAQTAIDSLTNIVQTNTDKIKVADALRALTNQLTTIDEKKAYEYGNQSILLSREIKYSHGEIEALNSIAALDKNQGLYSQSLTKLKEALQLAEKTNDESATADCYLNIGDVYSTLKNYDKAITNYEKSYELNKKVKNYDNAVNTLNRIANRNMDKGNFSNSSTDTVYIFKAIHIYEVAKSLAIKTKNIQKIVLAHVNLADAYNILGKKQNNKNYLYQAIDFSLRSLKLARENKLHSLEAISYLNIGEVYESLKIPTKAIHYYELALEIYRSIDDKRWILNTYSSLGKVYLSINNYNKASEYINLGVTSAKQLHLIVYLQDYYELLSKINAHEKNYQDAFKYHTLYSNYRDSIINEHIALNISRLQTELDFERKDKEIELLTKNTEIQNQKINTQTVERNFLTFAFLGILALLIIVYNRYRIKQKAELQMLKAKETAEQAQELQEQFLANTSHEIRTPMNGIIGMTSQLLDSPLNDEQLECALAIKESSNNLLVIINDLLDLSKIKAGKMVFEKTPFKLFDTFKNLIFTLQYRTTEKNIRLVSSIDESIPATISGDAVRLNQVLLNLAGNAVKFTEKGEIKISAKLLRDDGKNVRILFSVQDSGIGIPNHKLDKIFESFTQVNATTTRKYGGTGLGLTIAKQIIEQQNGSISVSSKVNEGSTFSFTLDFKKTKKKAIEVSDTIFSKSLNQNDSLSKINVLVVDDNRVNQRVAALTLQRWKVNVSVADDAKSAIEKLRETSFHIILMDIAMPDMDGLEATDYIRNKMEAPICNTPIIAMTASALIGEEEKCIAAGMNDYISKPFNPTNLYDKIEKLLPKDLKKSSSKLIDLTILHKRADGDNEYLKEIFESYITEMPIYISEMKEFLDNKDWKRIKMQAHKMRSPIALIGAIKLKKLLETIEFYDLDESENAKLIDMVDKSIIKSLKTIEEIRNELNLIS